MAPLGGLLATKYGGGTIFGIGVLMTGVTTLFTQLVLNINFYLFILTRVIEGLFEVGGFFLCELLICNAFFTVKGKEEIL